MAEESNIIELIDENGESVSFEHLATLEHEGGYETTYANLQSKPTVETGDSVSAGQIIGAVGTTAAAESGAPHLHFAVSRDGKAVDPRAYLEQ